MKKRVIITLLAAAMTAGLLAGCGSKKEEKQNQKYAIVFQQTNIIHLFL